MPQMLENTSKTKLYALTVSNQFLLTSVELQLMDYTFCLYYDVLRDYLCFYSFMVYNEKLTTSRIC